MRYRSQEAGRLRRRALVCVAALPLVALLGCGGRGASGRLVETVELEYRFVPVERVRVGEPVIFRLQLASSAPLRSGAVTVHYQVGRGWRSENMRPEGKGLYLLSLAPQKKGTRLRYYITITTPGGAQIVLPKGAPHRATYMVVVRGDVHPTLLTAHVVLMAAALLAWVGASLVARKVASKTGSVQRATFLASLGLGAFALGAFPVGMTMEYFAHGTLWSGWPLGPDRTEMRAIWVLLYWLLVLLVLRRKTAVVTTPTGWTGRLLERVYCWAIIGGTALTAVLFWNPHGRFF